MVHTASSCPSCPPPPSEASLHPACLAGPASGGKEENSSPRTGSVCGLTVARGSCTRCCSCHSLADTLGQAAYELYRGEQGLPQQGSAGQCWQVRDAGTSGNRVFMVLLIGYFLSKWLHFNRKLVRLPPYGRLFNSSCGGMHAAFCCNVGAHRAQPKMLMFFILFLKSVHKYF